MIMILGSSNLIDILQAGKSLVVKEVLLSLVREDAKFGVDRPDEVTVFYLSMEQLHAVGITFVYR